MTQNLSKSELDYIKRYSNPVPRRGGYFNMYKKGSPQYGTVDEPRSQLIENYGNSKSGVYRKDARIDGVKTPFPIIRDTGLYNNPIYNKMSRGSTYVKEGFNGSYSDSIRF